ncbi:MAG: hydrogenase iron-sulfur subunit [Anaerolineae bacterium]|nr:hydrogenase iron-sulfur subunit [Anaerolineae bacterium]MBL6965180.1 hydrogenase iron-sulfur subunit [Anaerolineales bacterium]
MATIPEAQRPKILILATLSGGYAGADSVGQLHTDYPTNTYILPVICPCMFPEEFYLRTFEQGIDGILVMYSGTDSPYRGGPERAAKLINQTYPLMKARGLDTRRLKLTAICTVCTKPFLKEVQQMEALLEGIGYAKAEIAAYAGKENMAN